MDASTSLPRFLRKGGLPLALLAIAAMALLTEPLLQLGREPARWVWHHGPADWAQRPWIFITLAILFQAVVGLVAIALVKRVLPGFDPCLRWPPGRTDVGLAIALGIAMGVVMLVADYWPLAFRRTAPHDYPTDPVNAAGWLLAMGVTGLAEEPIFRGLMVGALVVLAPGRVRIGRLDLPLAAYIVAALFALAHWHSFLSDPLPMAIAQQTYAIGWGLLYVWLMERSRSLLAPIVAHGVGDMVEVGLAILWRAAG